MSPSTAPALPPASRPPASFPGPGIAVVGTGYVGLCTGVAFAERGLDVTLVDVDPRKVAMVATGKAPFHEPGLDEALAAAVRAGRLKATGDLAQAVAGCGTIMLAVGTPQSDDGSMDLTYIRAAARQVGQALGKAQGRRLVVVKSTVLPGTARTVVGPEVEAGLGASSEPSRFELASNPEFLREGAAMQDARRPDRIVVGADSPAAQQACLSLYAADTCPKVAVDLATAEMIKYAANAMLAVRISASNELANLCTRIGVDWMEVAGGIGLDPRIGPLFLRAGAGYGGSCFPKDVAALRSHMARMGLPSRILDATTAVNEAQPQEVVRLVQEELGDLKGRRVAVLGLAFKELTDDIRSSRAFPLIAALRKAGAEVVGHDPQAAANFVRADPATRVAATWQDTVRGADAVVFQVEWPEYKAIEPGALAKLLGSPVVVDGRRTLDAAKARAAGLRYRAVGLRTA
ncbi:MAG TPA: UDP-glucose/GDP-mannose dehydrogenase family protein [Candidatus Thermoplasmatota archaeon]|nr:UDP-glucose/GDP-mannose dehydrogenase family protein [Candidatus Thermoplasmatota archaeon]